MDRLITILRAAHCRSTHQFFVVDALPKVNTSEGKNLATQFLKHHKRYLVGAKAPDKDFRDFHNHVVHVNDNHWGGAPRAAQEWYQNLVRKIREGQWSEAAYCAGVLSHYFTDPLMPLHTAQSKKESIVHRPLEWSVTCSYERIFRRYQEGNYQVQFQIASCEGWVPAAVRKGAEMSNRHYDELIDRYNLKLGAKKPKQGFDDTSIDILAGLFGVALTGWAKIVDRAAEDANVRIPEASLSVASLVASITMPAAWVVRRIASASEQRAVRAIFNEYQATGTVVKNLPAEVVQVELDRENERSRENKRRQTARLIQSTPKPTPIASANNDERTAGSALKPAEKVVAEADSTISKPPTVPFPTSPDETDKRTKGSPKRSRRQAKPRLAMTDDLVDAPSIGPKTAKRFAAIGILTVQQFLDGSPEEMATRLKTRWIKSETIRDWQAQARLVASIASLCGYKAQLLVGVDCRSTDNLATEQAEDLHERITQFAGTTEGKRALRSSRIPDLDQVSLWITDAESAMLRKSA